jgi:hypothetical protein
MKTPAADHVFNTWAHIKHPYVDSKPSPQPVSQKCGSEFKGRIQAPGKRSIQVPNQPCQNQPKKARLSSFSTLQVKTQLPDLGTVYISQPLPSTSGLSPKQAPKVTTKTPTLNPSIHNKPLPCSPYLLQAQAVVQPLLSSHVPGKPDKIGSMGSDKGWQNSKIRMTPTSNPPEKCTSAGQSPHILKESEGLAPHVPRSVLYEDLMVSSSSEDSDWEWDPLPQWKRLSLKSHMAWKWLNNWGGEEAGNSYVPGISASVCQWWNPQNIGDQWTDTI